MISARSFDRALYNKLKLIVSVQKDLSKLSNANIKEIGTKIIFQKEIAKSQSGISILSQCFNDEADFHPKNIETLVDLFIFLIQSANSSNYLHLLKEYTVACIRTREKVRPSFLFFLRTLLNRRIISIDLLIREISLMYPQFSKEMKKTTSENQAENDQTEIETKIDNNNLDFQIEDENFTGPLKKFDKNSFLKKKFRVIDWFYPEISTSNSKFLNAARNELNYTIADEFKDNNFDLILPIMNTGYSNEKLAKIIREDDIDSFTKIVSEIGQRFDFNQTIKSTRFDRCFLLSADPTLIQYASFFGSEKIFKYLFLNKADIEIVSKNMYTICHFAVCGGCSEIIHILAQQEVEFLSAIPIAIQFSQNDILQWLIENYAPKSDEDILMMDYYRCNIKYNARRIFRRNYFVSLNHQTDDTDDDYYQHKTNRRKNDPIRKLRFRNTYPQQDSSDYSDFDVIVDEKREEEEYDYNDTNNDDFFSYFNFDLLFESIVNSENYLSLFLLFDQGMSINACNADSKKTILHYAIQKGKSFLVDLLLSNDLIDVSLNDSNEQSPIVYSVKYTRKNIFFKMIKMQKVLDALNDHDFIQMAFYANYLELNDITEYLMSINSINLINLMDLNDIKNFCDAVTYLPFNFFKHQIEEVLIESFRKRRFDYFSIFACRVLKSNDIISLSSVFYFCPKSQLKAKDMEKDFASLFQLLYYYAYSFPYEPYTNYYKLYYLNIDGSRSGRINYETINQFKEDVFYLLNNKNCIYIYCVKDPKDVKGPKVVVQFPNDQKVEKKIKKKKTNNNPTIVINDYDDMYSMTDK